jgi:tetratricopeptide (TPR) repeat protein
MMRRMELRKYSLVSALVLILLIFGCQPENSYSTPNIFKLVHNDLEADAPNLDSLFQMLRTADNSGEIELIEARIRMIWMESGQPEIDNMMEAGNKAITSGDYTKAVELFTRVTEQLPDYAEGWNKRATAHYMKGEYQAAIEDINKTLSIECRHFGALSGLASIYISIGDYRSALKALEQLLEIRPNQAKLQEQVNALYQKLGIRNV